MNRLLIKLSGVLSIAFSIVNIFVFIGIHFVIPYTVLSDNIYCYIMSLIIAIVSFICLFGGIIFIHYKDLDDTDLKKNEYYILAWSLFFLFFCPISGILGFMASFLTNNHMSNNSKSSDYINELKELELLLKEGYITEEEFKLKKQKILKI